MIPMIATITVGRRSTYWIPLALFWIPLVPLFIIGLILAFLPLAIVRINPFLAIAAVWQILSAVRGSELAFLVRGKLIEVEL